MKFVDNQSATPLPIYTGAMFPSDQPPSNSAIATPRKNARRAIALLTVVCLLAVLITWTAIRLTDERDYLRYATPREESLVHATGQITLVSNHIPYLEIRLDDGRDVLATFLVFPQQGGHGIYVTNTGAFDARKLPSLARCGHAEFEFYPMHGTMISYWIYGLRCNGTELLSYQDTMSYLTRRKP
ncbi:hypothetical protein E2553_40470 [Paraburkholderia dipogonis]|uniref:Uncharacterized protein n=1 Tax=Paraburkholderia dipogonis TaxID=1211383 RepID=A0A4Y8MJP6_9BURK|nr:hypothetical protein [Paraburkholderia dipogonis]TFE37679.1 hypothetical protein E2553_40470 [Paraburkholderia dipogonis]